MEKYVFRPYNPIFPQLFAAEKARLQQLLGNEALIEHMGSTSVPGLGGKGFIDILIGVDRERMPAVSECLVASGYLFAAEAGTVERFYHERVFIDPQGQENMYHIHLTFPGGYDWNAVITFREYLRNNPTAVQEYAAIKKYAASICHGERRIYAETKNPVIARIMEAANSQNRIS